MNGLIEFGLKLAGIPDNVVADIEKASPQLAQVIALIKQLEPILSKSQPFADHIAQATPIIKASLPLIHTLIPIAQEVMVFALPPKTS